MVPHATYCPEDNKLRIYPVERFDKEMYSRLRQAGYSWAPVQELFVCPSWNTEAEDLALEICGHIEDEDMPPEERAADRAERFMEYQEKRSLEANGYADSYDSGPQVHGHHSLARAQRSAARHDRQAGRAINQWSKAEYWQRRTQGVISNALYKSRPDVRERRIKKIEASLRKYEKQAQERCENHRMVYRTMKSILAHAAGEGKLSVPSHRWFAWSLSNYKKDSDDTYSADTLRRAAFTCAIDLLRNQWSTLSTDVRLGDRDPVEAAKEVLEWYGDEIPAEYNPEDHRTACHYRLRLAYEFQMMEAETGGMASATLAADLGPGWVIGNDVIHKVTKSPKTGRITAVWLHTVRNDGRSKLIKCTIDGMSDSAFEKPTPVSMATLQRERQLIEQSKPKQTVLPLLNPSKEEAAKLVEIWNKDCTWRFNRSNGVVKEMTQQEYSQATSHPFNKAETIAIHADGLPERRNYGPLVARIRCLWTNEAGRCIVHLVDKKTHPINIEPVVNTTVPVPQMNSATI